MDNVFIRIFNKYKNDILRLAYSYLKNISDAEDITQNVFIKLYKHNNILLQDDNDIKKWLIKVTINECKTNLVSLWKRNIHLFKDNEQDILCSSDDKEDYLLNIIMSLKKRYRLVIYLFYYEGYKIKDISKLLNISISNVQTILQRARLELERKMKDE